MCQIARRANQRLTPLRRREKSRRQHAIIDEVRQEILERTRQKTTNAFSQEMQSCKERLPDCATGCVRPWCCHRRRCQPGRTVPAPAGRENENRCTGCCQLLASSCSWISSYTAPWSKDPLAGPKHHGRDGRIRPAAGSPYCQTLLSELTRN